MTQPVPDIFNGGEPAGGFPGDQESGGWAGEPGDRVLTLGGQIASRGTGELDPLHGQSSESAKFEQWPPASMGPKLYQFDSSGNQTAVARPGE